MSWKSSLLGAALGVGIGIVAERRIRRSTLVAAGPTLSELGGPIAGVSEGWVRTPDGARLFYREAGNGPATLLLLHGMLLDGRVFRYQIQALSDRFRVIAPDLRGHGRSDVADMGTHIRDRHAPDIVAILEHLDAKNTVVVGHSFGGMALQQFLCDYPGVRDERLAGAVLLSTAPMATAVLPDGRHVPERYARPINRTVEFAFGRLAALAERDLHNYFTTSDAARFGARATFGRKAYRGDVDFVLQLVRETSPQTVADVLRVTNDFDVVDRLAEVPTTTLVVVGTRDLVAPAYLSRIQARALPKAELVAVDGAGHNIFFEEPEYLSTLLAEFTERVHGQSRASADLSPRGTSD